MRSIFVGGLHTDTTSDDLKAYFTQFSPVGDINMPLKRKSGKCKGFAFVNIFVESSLKFAEILSREHLILSKRVDVEETMCTEEKIRRIQKLQENKVFIGRFSKNEDIRRVAKELSKYCEVKTCSFVNSKVNRRALLLQAELADPKVCTLLAERGFFYRGYRYSVSLYKPKAAWAAKSEEPKGTPSTQQATNHMASPLEEYGSPLAHSIKKSSLSNQLTSNYRFNISANLQQRNGLFKLNSATQCILSANNPTYDLQYCQYSTHNLNSPMSSGIELLTRNANATFRTFESIANCTKGRTGLVQTETDDKLRAPEEDLNITDTANAGFGGLRRQFLVSNLSYFTESPSARKNGPKW